MKQQIYFVLFFSDLLLVRLDSFSDASIQQRYLNYFITIVDFSYCSIIAVHKI